MESLKPGQLLVLASSISLLAAFMVYRYRAATSMTVVNTTPKHLLAAKLATDRADTVPLTQPPLQLFSSSKSIVLTDESALDVRKFVSTLRLEADSPGKLPPAAAPRKALIDSVKISLPTKWQRDSFRLLMSGSKSGPIFRSSDVRLPSYLQQPASFPKKP